MTRKRRPIRSAALAFIRTLRGMERAAVAEAAGMKESMVDIYERGKEEPGMSTLERLTHGMGVSTATLDQVLAVAEEVLREETSDVWMGPVLVSAARLKKTREFGEEMGRISRESFGEWLIRTWVEEQAEADRETARQIGFYLKGRKNLVETLQRDTGSHLWSIAEWLCDESMKAAPQDWERAAELAAAALLVAEQAPGETRFRQRLQAYCWGHIGNARRVSGNLRAADSAFERCAELWAAGLGGDPFDFLDSGRILGMEASLRRAQGRFCEALQLLRKALPVARPELQPHLHINYAKVLEEMENYEEAIVALREASLWMSSETPLPLVFAQQFNLLVNLCHLGRHGEAEGLLPNIWKLGQELGSETDLTRLRWLQGRVDAGRGRQLEAEEGFLAVQQQFLAQGNAFDAARVSLDLASLHLERGETEKVRALVEEMASVFVDQGVHHEAQKALLLFSEAVKAEVVTSELAVRIARYLERSRRAPGLRFEAETISSNR